MSDGPPLSLSEKLSRVEIDQKELEALRLAYKTITRPVYDAMGRFEDNKIELIIAKRVLFGIATLVEASRDALVCASVSGNNSKPAASLGDLLLHYAPEYLAMDQKMIALAQARLEGESPSAIMKSLGWSIQSDRALDGQIRAGFTDQQFYELGKIHELK